MNISPHFTPPLHITLPYFFSALAALFIFSLLLLDVDVDFVWHDWSTVAAIHIYLLGFVMMTFFVAMAQLLPVLSEHAHVALKLFYLIGPFVLVGLGLMLIGFLSTATYLLYGAGFVLLGMLLFVIDFIGTIIQAKRKNSVIYAMFFANMFLLVGILSGVGLALAYNGMVDVTLASLFTLHIFSITIGYVLLTQMSVSMILIPMFAPAHKYSKSAFKLAFISLVLANIALYAELIFKTTWLSSVVWALFLSAILFYLIQLTLHYRHWAQKVHDVYAKSIYTSILSLATAWVLLVIYTFTTEPLLLKSALWFFAVGFIGFHIMGHLYKIIPFLVWFKKFAPIVDESPVPLLHEMVHKKFSYAQWIMTTLGVWSMGFALLWELHALFRVGSILFVIGIVLLWMTLVRVVSIKS